MCDFFSVKKECDEILSVYFLPTYTPHQNMVRMEQPYFNKTIFRICVLPFDDNLA